jgi:hypothetical protein
MSDRRVLLNRLAPAALVLLLAGAIAVPLDGALDLASGDGSAAAGLTQALDALPDEPTVLVGFDPDIGTFAEIRPTVRAVLADLLNRRATLAFVSLTPEGRALGLLELARMDRGEANPRQIVDGGFLPGAEAALVALASELDPQPGDPISSDLADRKLDALDAVLVVGGIDIGPRSWVEQLRPRLGGVPLFAVAPSVLLPELEPYRDSGQLRALIATPRDGASYRAAAKLGRLDRLVDERDAPAPAAIALGMLAAIAVLGAAFIERLGAVMRLGRARDAA